MVTPPTYATLDEWIAQAAILFAVDSPASRDAAIDAVIATLGDEVDLLGFGECLHGGEELLILRNRIFERLVEAHGFRAIAIESCYIRGGLVQEYVAGRGPASYAAIQDDGFSYGFGVLDANHELVEWMRAYNANPAHRVPIHFYGFDMPATVAARR